MADDKKDADVSAMQAAICGAGQNGRAANGMALQQQSMNAHNAAMYGLGQLQQAGLYRTDAAKDPGTASRCRADMKERHAALTQQLAQVDAWRAEAKRLERMIAAYDEPKEGE